MRRQLLEDTLVAVMVLGIFSLVFTVTHAFHGTVASVASVSSALEKSEMPQPHDVIPHFLSEAQAYAGTSIDEAFPELLPEEGEDVSEPDKQKESPKIEKTTPAVALLHVDANPKPIKAAVTVQKPKSEYAKTLASLIEQKTNAFRKQNDLPALAYEPTLEKSATKYSQTMLKGNFLSHTDQSGCDFTCRFKASGYDAMSWGENLAMLELNGNTMSAEEVASYFMKEWEKSAGHRENLLSPKFSAEGIGVALDGNSIYVTVQFYKPMP